MFVFEPKYKEICGALLSDKSFIAYRSLYTVCVRQKNY